jgi:membrane protease YdiL (CAAX protease family)
MKEDVSVDRIPGPVGKLLQANKLIIAAELGAAFVLCFVRVFPFSVQIFLLAFSSLSLWLRGLTWRDVGLRRFKAWWKIALWALLAAFIISIVANLLVQPLIDRLVSRPVNNSRFENLRGHLPVLLGWLSAVWTIVAFGEEMVFRGYLMNRIADLVGRSRTGWASALIGSSLIFGLAHGYQGLAGIISTAEVGLLLGILYLISKRNLWINVVCHGAFDSISLLALYFS